MVPPFEENTEIFIYIYNYLAPAYYIYTLVVKQESSSSNSPLHSVKTHQFLVVWIIIIHTHSPLIY